MILKTLKRNFSEALTPFYPETEIDAFFNLLAEEILNLKRVDIALNLYAVVSGKKNDKFNDAIKSLQEQEPIQYILGRSEFYELPFNVNKDVLIPRPETEELVHTILKTAKDKDHLQILDIGTGSGCIAISLAKHLPNANISALDVSEKALSVAKKNAKLNNVEVTFLHKNILDFELGSTENEKPFNIIVSNPPYVRQQEKNEMNANVLDYEPHLALFVEDDNPLLFYETIAKLAVNGLEEKGLLFFEINEYLGNEMVALLEHYRFKNIELIKDISGKDRIVKATK